MLLARCLRGSSLLMAAFMTLAGCYVNRPVVSPRVGQHARIDFAPSTSRDVLATSSADSIELRNVQTLRVLVMDVRPDSVDVLILGAPAGVVPGTQATLERPGTSVRSSRWTERQLSKKRTGVLAAGITLSGLTIAAAIAIASSGIGPSGPIGQ